MWSVANHILNVVLGASSAVVANCSSSTVVANRLSSAVVANRSSSSVLTNRLFFATVFTITCTSAEVLLTSVER